MKIKTLHKILAIGILSVLVSACEGYLMPYQASLVQIAKSEGVNTATYAPQTDVYTIYKLNGFDILTHPERPNELLIYRDGKVLSLINSDLLRVYQPNASNLPLSEYEMFTYDANSNFATYRAQAIYYSDYGMDGIDMTSQVIADTPDYTHSEFQGKPITKIIKAHIDHLDCKPLFVDSACCLTADGSYTPYHFSHHKGWQNIADNKKMQVHCNR